MVVGGVVLGMIRMVNDSGSGAERGWFRLRRGKDGVEKEVKRGTYCSGVEKLDQKAIKLL
jgi:hypothetical protein